MKVNEYNLQRLEHIANVLGLQSVVNQITHIRKRAEQSDAELILPLVGEFSSGKTTLINAFTDCKALETATMPTTATIYEVHFGCDKSSAIVLSDDGSEKEVLDFTELKNASLKEAEVVTVFDTSKELSSDIVLIDTPGLSSPDPKHKQVLVDFLPQADAILLVSDINQQLTKSLTDFAKTLSLSKKPVYLVLTKCDTKNAAAVEEAKNYIQQHSELKLDGVVAVSATQNKLSEIQTIFAQLQQRKKEILRAADEERLQSIATLLINELDRQRKALQSDDALEDALESQATELSQLNKTIKRFLESCEDEIQALSRKISVDYEDSLQSKLYNIVQQSGIDYDATTYATASQEASLRYQDFRTGIQHIAKSHSSDFSRTSGLTTESLHNLDLSSIEFAQLSHDINLNSIGHQYDGTIGIGLKISAAVAAVAAVAIAAPAAGTAAAGTASSAANTAAAVATAANVADTVTDVASVVSNAKTVSKMKRLQTTLGKGVKFGMDVKKQYDTNEQTIVAKEGDSDFVKSIVSKVTDKMLGKPQRKRLIRQYIDESLSPAFKRNLERNRSVVLNVIESCISEENKVAIQEKTQALKQLQQEIQEQRTSLAERKKEFETYKKELLSL